MRVVSIQSHVASGHVGNAASVFPMQRLGIEVLPVHTLQFSNHPGHGTFGGTVFSADHIAAVLAGLEAHGAVAQCEAILTGYLGSAEIAEVVEAFIRRAKQSNPALIYACDPVIGDRDRGIYVRADLASTIASRLVPLADILFPNAFELEYLSGIAIKGDAAFRQAAGTLAAHRGATVVTTSLDHPGIASDRIATALRDSHGVEVAEQRRIARHFSGAGDCFAGLFLAFRLLTQDSRAALWQASTALAALLAKTGRLGLNELALIEGQSAFRLRSAMELARANRRT